MGVMEVSSTIVNEDDVRKAITRIAHEIVERNPSISDVVIVGMQRGGVWLAEAIATEVARIAPGASSQHGSVDVSMYRDDIGLRSVTPAATAIPRDIEGKVVVLVDDVLFTGRTVRAALDALVDHGRPAAIQLAVMVDRGHRELPIRPDFVGKNVPTHLDDEVEVSAGGVVVRRNTDGAAR